MLVIELNKDKKLRNYETKLLINIDFYIKIPK